MKISIFKAFAAISLTITVGAVPSVAFADGTTISNSPAGFNLEAMGGPATPAFGQVFTAPVTGKLTSFQLSLDRGVGSLSGGVGTWTGGPTFGLGYGSPTNLYLSDPIASTAAAAYNFVTNVDVIAGNQYIAYLDTYGNSNSNSSAAMVLGTNAPYIDYFVYNDAGSAVGKAQWGYYNTIADLDRAGRFGNALFSATFTDGAVGAPEIDGGKLPLALMLLGLLFVITRRTRRGRLLSA